MSFEMFAGDTKRLHFTLTSGAPNNDPLDITDATIQWQVSKGTTARFSAIPVISKATDDGIVITDSFAGTLTIDLLPEDTENLKGNFYYELQIVDATGDIATAATGQITIKPALIRQT